MLSRCKQAVQTFSVDSSLEAQLFRSIIPVIKFHNVPERFPKFNKVRSRGRYLTSSCIVYRFGPIILCCTLYHCTRRKNNIGSQAHNYTTAIVSRCYTCVQLLPWWNCGLVTNTRRSFGKKRKVPSHYKVP